MGTNDLILAPIFLIIIYIIAFWIRNKYYADSPLRKYFIPGLTLKLIGALASGVIYFFYYGDGDTVYYYNRALRLSDIFTYSPESYIQILFADPSKYYPGIHSLLASLRAWDTSSFMVVKITSLFSLITFRNYSCIAILFAFFSFSGIWMLFKTFSDLYPEKIKEAAIACLFIPSVFFWGSGVFKDTISIGFVGWITYSFYILFIKKERSKKTILMLLVSFYMLYVVKSYIIYCLIPSFMFWLFFKYRSNIKNTALRAMITPLIIFISIFMGITFINQASSVEQISKQAYDMQWWHTRVVEIYGEEGGGGSYYSIGTAGDFSLGNIIKSFPLAVNVTLFRPYLWEAGSPVMLMSALESLVLFIFTLKVLFSTGLPKTLQISMANPIIFFCILFSIFFAFAVGFTSFNFGALVRYKIPCLPFYVMALFLIRYHANKDRDHSNKDKKLPELAATE